jgi:hypothetical protein
MLGLTPVLAGSSIYGRMVEENEVSVHRPRFSSIRYEKSLATRGKRGVR